MPRVRHSPLLPAGGKEIALPFAPAPWKLRQCCETGLVFLANPPDYQDLNRTYAYEVTFDKETRARRAAEPLRYAVSTALKRFRGRILRRNKMLGILREQIARSRAETVNVLDVGCGWGSLLDDLFGALPDADRQRCVPHGIEISQALSQLSDRKFRALGGRCIHAPSVEGIQHFDAGFFDVIVMASYLEHDTSPLQILERCRSRLKPGGTIIVKVPNYACFNRMVRGPRWCGFRWPDHVNYFTPATLALLVDKAGLRIARMRWRDRNPLSDNMYAILSAAS